MPSNAYDCGDVVHSDALKSYNAPENLEDGMHSCDGEQFSSEVERLSWSHYMIEVLDAAASFISLFSEIFTTPILNVSSSSSQEGRDWIFPYELQVPAKMKRIINLWSYL